MVSTYQAFKQEADDAGTDLFTLVHDTSTKVAVGGVTLVDSGTDFVASGVAAPQFVRLSDGSSAITTLAVSIASVPSHAVTNAGVFSVQVSAGTVDTVTTVSTVTTCSTVTTLTGGSIAHDSADGATNPLKIGARTTASLSGATMVDAADRTNLYAGIDGVLINRPHTNLEDIVSGNATNTDGTATQCIAAQAANIKTYLTTIILANSGGSNITVDIKDGSTVKLSIPVPAGGGAVCNLAVPLPGTAATAWNFDPSAASTTVTCSMVGFRSKV